ncbi:MAG TPA: ATP-dependent Clp protease ATP-binding subunit ClpX [Polyangia bacterium]|jgi:ATP-dependent Clp protease ATP-binding subunit ClpX|nr:ATP-dependent Clp protease ATP-binding subunit ClpX [Polyangia bacterium]
MKSQPRTGARRDLGSAATTPRQIFEHLDRYVMGQERAKRTLAIAAANHLKRCAQKTPAGKRLIKKSNVLLVGPTGSGKTHLARTLAQCLDVPFTVADATEYTEAGYYGKDVEVMIGELLAHAGQDVELAQRGIVFVDEIDKIARRSQGARTGAGARDIGGEGVQQSLLKLLEGREVFAPLNVTQHWNKHDFVVVDTQDILFIAAGTFGDLAVADEPKPVGFGRGAAERARGRRVTEKDLLDYGLLAELLGRIPVRVELEPLSAADLLAIMTRPPDSVIREYQALLKMDGVDLRFSEAALRAIASWCVRRKTGARSLRTLLEEICHDVMFDAPELEGQTFEVDAAYAEERLERLAEGLARDTGDVVAVASSPRALNRKATS